MPARKSPSDSATLHDVGTKLKGSDGQMWEVALVKPKSGKKAYHQWRRVKSATATTTTTTTTKKRTVVAKKKQPPKIQKFNIGIDSGLLVLGDPSAHFPDTQRPRDDKGMVPVHDLDRHYNDWQGPVQSFSHGQGLLVSMGGDGLVEASVQVNSHGDVTRIILDF
jgi:hypothetical protein